MPEDSILLNPGTGGERIRTRSSMVNAVEVHEQAIYRPGEDTYYVYAEHSLGAGVMPIVLNNAAASGVFVQVRKLFVTNISAATAAVTRFDIKRGTGLTGGTALTPIKADSLNANLPAGVTAARGPSSMGTETLLFPWLTITTANTTTQALTTAQFQQATNILMEADAIQELTLQPGESFGAKQVAGSTLTTLFGWTLVFTVTAL